MLLNPYRFAVSGGGSGFSPDDLAGLQAWYDADDLIDPADSELASWPDRMGSFNASRTSAAGTGALLRYSAIGGKKAVEFRGFASAGKYTMSSSLMSGATSGSFYAVMLCDADPPGLDQNGGGVLSEFTSSSGNSHHPFSDGNIYEAFGTSSRKTVGNPTPSLTSARIYNTDSAASNFRARLDGTQIFSTTSNTVSFGTKTRSLGWSDGSTDTYYDGKVGEVLIYNSVLAQADREKVEGYLAHKFGLTANLPALHPYKTVAP